MLWSPSFFYFEFADESLPDQVDALCIPPQNRQIRQPQFARQPASAAMVYYDHRLGCSFSTIDRKHNRQNNNNDEPRTNLILKGYKKILLSLCNTTSMNTYYFEVNLS